MPALIGILADPSHWSADGPTAMRMAAAAPHRGTELRQVSLGNALVGVATGDDAYPAWVSAFPGGIAAVVGYIDDAGDLPQQGLPADLRSNPAAAIGSLVLAKGAGGAGALRGSFAAVVSDGTRLWALRDQVGFRPLFYRASGAGVVVATEPRQVAAGARLPYRPDLDMVERIFHGRVEGRTASALAGVERVPARTLVEWGTEGSKSEHYWRPEEILETEPLSESELQVRFDQVMRQAVERCLTGVDGIALSGGLDSPALAAYGVEEFRTRFGRGLPAVSAVYPHLPKVDESKYIEAVSAALGMPLYTIVPGTRPTDGLSEWVRLLNGPVSVVSLNEGLEHLLFAKANGVRNLLTGELAEYVVDSRQGTLPYLLASRRWRAAFRWSAAERRRGVPVAQILRSIVAASLPPWALRALRPTPTLVLPDWIDPEVAGRPPVLSRVERWRMNQVLTAVGLGLGFEAEDVVQSIAGASIRCPFADIDVWELFLRLPAEQKYPDNGRKTLFRRLLRDRVPEVILNRQGRTFFDDYVMSSMDYDLLDRLVKPGDYMMTGVNYARLGELIRDRKLDLRGFAWAKDLAAAHAFVEAASSGGAGPPDRDQLIQLVASHVGG